MEARELENENLLVPVAVEGPGGALFDGMFGIGPDHPDYVKWRPFVNITSTGHQAAPEAG